MAARNTTHTSGMLQRGICKLFVKAPGTAANLTTTYGLGMSTTIVKGAAGTYTITLSDKWAAFIHADFTIIDPNAPDDWTVNVVSETVSTTKTIVITTFKGGAAADLTTDETLTGEIVLLNSTILPVKG